MNPCTQPLSWLTLERYALGEVKANERGLLDAHLAACAHCRSDLDLLLADPRPLPPLTRAAEVSPGQTRWRWAGALALTAGLLVAGLWIGWPREGRPLPPPRLVYKGGELALGLVLERQGQTHRDPRAYLPGDRLSVSLTCPPGEDLQAELIVFEDQQAHFPLARVGALACGNQVALPGAFRLTGRGPVSICVLVAARLPSREELERMPLGGWSEQAVCAQIAAVDP